MTAKKQIWIQVALLISLVVVWTIGTAQIARAGNFLPRGTLSSSEVIDDDVFTLGQQVTIDGTIHGDAFILGNKVQINGTVDGSLFVIGQQVSIQGDVSGTAYMAAVAAELGSQAVLQRSLYFTGVSLVTQADSSVQRDLNTVCLGASLNGNVERNTKGLIGILEVVQWLLNKFGGGLLIPGFNFRLGSLLPLGVTGSLVSAPFLRLVQDTAPASSIDTAQLSAWLLDRLRDFGLLLLLGAIFYWIFRAPLNRTSQALRLRPLPALGYGLLALLITTNIFLVGLLVASLIFVIGFWLGSLGLWSFTIAFWIVSFAALAFFLAVIWFLVAYGTKLVVVYLAGTWFFKKIAPKASIPPFVGLVVGLLVYVLLHSIPLLGWVIAVLVTAWGLGGFWLAYRKGSELTGPEPVTETEPVIE